ncbi:MAG: dockerin type I repeat-containing protein [Bacteroidaceae bacterium]|jgi:hypothetical protein|nr:dockerin type I repeat-containing protein [Bacteroidaceae bacterium]
MTGGSDCDFAGAYHVAHVFVIDAAELSGGYALDGLGRVDDVQALFAGEGADQNYNPITAAELRKNGNEHLYAKLYANNQEIPVKSIFDETDRCIYGYQTELGIVPNSISNAATAFLQGLYWNELTVKVSDGTLQLGIKKDEYVFYDWTCFDSFRLYYYGQDRNTGDANGNGEVEIGDVTSVLTLMATPEATGYNNKAADANGNGEIEIGDVTTILTIMAGN